MPIADDSMPNFYEKSKNMILAILIFQDFYRSTRTLIQKEVCRKLIMIVCKNPQWSPRRKLPKLSLSWDQLKLSILHVAASVTHGYVRCSFFFLLPPMGARLEVSQMNSSNSTFFTLMVLSNKCTKSLWSSTFQTRNQTEKVEDSYLAPFLWKRPKWKTFWDFTHYSFFKLRFNWIVLFWKKKITD